MGVGEVPNPGPQRGWEGRGWHHFREEERRAADLAAVRHPIVADLARRCLVDYDEYDERAAAAEIATELGRFVQWIPFDGNHKRTNGSTTQTASSRSSIRDLSTWY